MDIPPLPTPYAIEVFTGTESLNTTPFWDIENLKVAISTARTIPVLFQQDGMDWLKIIFALLFASIVIAMFASLSARKQSNL